MGQTLESVQQGRSGRRHGTWISNQVHCVPYTCEFNRTSCGDSVRRMRLKWRFNRCLSVAVKLCFPSNTLMLPLA